MIRLYIFIYTLLVVCLCLTSCATKSAEGEALEYQKAINSSEKIVTIGGTITEIVHALGLGEQIIATDRTSTYPPSMQQLPSLGYRNSIQAEGIISQNADLILAEEEYMNKAVYVQLQDAGINIHTFHHELNIEGTKKLMLEIAQVLEVPERAEPLIDSLEQDMKRVDQLLATYEAKPKVIFVYARGQASLQIGGAGTFSEEMIHMAGGELAVSQIKGFKPLTTESLIQANPDFILFFESGLQSLGGVDGVLQIPGVAQTTAGRKKQIIALDGLFLSGFGPRVGSAVYNLASLIHQPNMDQL